MWNGQEEFFHHAADGPWDEQQHGHPSEPHQDGSSTSSFPERAFEHHAGAAAHTPTVESTGLQWMSVGQPGASAAHHPHLPPASYGDNYPLSSPTTNSSSASHTNPSGPPNSGSFGILTPSSTVNPSASLGGASGEDFTDDVFSQAIEEDKRRRNTAASARFRLKKKEREAELERTTKSMNRRCDDLHKRVSELETENRWLRELITERSRNRGFKTRRPDALGMGGKKMKRGSMKTPEEGDKVAIGGGSEEESGSN